MKQSLLCAMALMLTLFLSSCGEEEIPGCTNPAASNYNVEATESDGSCIFTGCTDPESANYDPDANQDDGSCQYPGCIDTQSDQYDDTANVDDGSCSTYFDRWTGTFAGEFGCEGLLDQFFGDASMQFSKLELPDNTDSMEVFIEFTLSDLPLNFGSTITRDSMYAYGFFEGITADTLDLIPTIENEVFDIEMKGTLGINDLNDMVDGTLVVTIKETSSGLGIEFVDRCAFDGLKQ